MAYDSVEAARRSLVGCQVHIREIFPGSAFDYGAIDTMMEEFGGKYAMVTKVTDVSDDGEVAYFRIDIDDDWVWNTKCVDGIFDLTPAEDTASDEELMALFGEV